MFHTKSRLVVYALALGLVVAAGPTAFAQSAGSGNAAAGSGSAIAAPKEAAAPAPLAVTVIGTNYCLGCALKKEQGAAAQCSVYGHRHALRVARATAKDGAELPELAGLTLHYLDNDGSTDLLAGKDLHGKTVEVHGRLFEAERTLEVAKAHRH